MTTWLIDPHTLWSDYRPTSLIELPALAQQARVGRVFAKLENERPLGNFKVLGGMVAGLRALARAAGVATVEALLAGDAGRSLPPLLCASDGNHGLAVAAAAQRAGTRATIYLPVGVSAFRAARIEALGGEVAWIDGTYDDAVDAAARSAQQGEGLLIADTTDDPDDVVVHDVMAGYGLLTQELRKQLSQAPSHVFLQAGVGGLAAAVAEGLHDQLRSPDHVCVVEPESCPCVAQALALGQPQRIPGDLHTAAEMLACGVASAPALQILQRYRAQSALVSEADLQRAVSALRAAGGPASTPSGAAGLAGLLKVAAEPALRERHQLDTHSTVLVVITEAALDELSASAAAA